MSHTHAIVVWFDEKKEERVLTFNVEADIILLLTIKIFIVNVKSSSIVIWN